MKKSILEQIEREAIKLAPQAQLKLVERLINNLRKAKIHKTRKIDWNELYGAGKGIWQEDAQVYVNKLRKDRI